LNRKAYVDALLDHPLGVVVEFPQSGYAPTRAVAHRFAVNPDHPVNPRANIQYSLGGTTAVKGSCPHGNCYLFSSAMGTPVPCKVSHVGCELIQVSVLNTLTTFQVNLGRNAYSHPHIPTFK